MKEWSNAEVLGWLTHRFGLWGQQYVPVFSNKDVDGMRLSQLTKDELQRDFGINKALHLVRIYRDIEDAQRPIHSINQLIAPYVCYLLTLLNLVSSTLPSTPTHSTTTN